MAYNKLSDTLAQQAIDAWAKYGITKAARLLGVPLPTLESRLRVAKQRGIKPGAGITDPDDLQSLRGQVKRLETEVRVYERQTEHERIIEGLVGGLAEKIKAYEPPAWTLSAYRTAGSPGVPTLFLSDLHWGEVVFPSQINDVNEYNLRIARKRLRRAVERTTHLLGIIDAKMNYPGIVLSLGGDMISGDLHEELTATNEMPSIPTVLDLFGELVQVIKLLVAQFGAVFIPCVTGNHGKNTRKIWAKSRHHTSFDWLLYQFLAKHFAEDKRVTFHIPDGIAAHYKVYGHRYRLSHGDKLGKGGDGIIGAIGPIIRGDQRTRSRDAQIDLGYDTQTVGHWHQYMHLTRVIVNGSLKGYDEYANVEGFPFEEPQQALWLTHPKHGITYRMPVYVGEKQQATETSWVSVPK